MKYAHISGMVACSFLILFCFLPWAYYPDLQKDFTGFYSMQNHYGKPGIALVFFGLVNFILFLIPTIWSRRISQFIAVLLFAYSLKTYFLFSSCYQGICPQVKPGLAGVMISAILILISSLLSKVKIKEREDIK